MIASAGGILFAHFSSARCCKSSYCLEMTLWVWALKRKTLAKALPARVYETFSTCKNVNQCEAEAASVMLHYTTHYTQEDKNHHKQARSHYSTCGGVHAVQAPILTCSQVFKVISAHISTRTNPHTGTHAPTPCWSRLMKPFQKVGSWLVKKSWLVLSHTHSLSNKKKK